MSNKLWCPGCDSETSELWRVVHEQGGPCPYCGLPAEAIQLVLQAKEKNLSNELTNRFMEAEQRAAAAEKEARQLREQIRRIKEAVDHPVVEVDW